MNADEIRDEIVAQNLNSDLAKDLKVIYTFKAKQDRQTTSCILEVSPAARKALFANGRIYIRYSSCTFADHVRVVQCYRCLSFGHYAVNCKAGPTCGHCAGIHETKDCKSRDQPPKCYNCQ